MALDFYYITDIKFEQRLFEISHEDWTELGEILVGFYKVTGIRIDEYGTSRIYADHVRLIASNLEAYLRDTKTINASARIKLNRILGCLLKVEGGFLIVGD